MFDKFGINQAHFLCPGCVHAARIWSEVMEMSGFHDQHGQFQPMCPPLRLPTIFIPKIDGVYDMDFVTVMEHHAKIRATGDVALQRRIITSHLPFGKLIWQQNNGMWTIFRCIPLLKIRIFHCHVCFPSVYLKRSSWSSLFPNLGLVCDPKEQKAGDS